MRLELPLHASQSAALAHVTSLARLRRGHARKVLDEVRAMSNLAAEAFELGVANILKHARVALHFHPDRPDAQLRTVAENLLAGGIYKSQFETLLSNGSVTAFPGGARDLWEQKLFGGAYQSKGTSAAHRPKYGALDLMRHADGAAPRFGSCYLLLAPEVSARSTFTYLDSYYDPTEKGTYEELDDVLAALFNDAFTRECALGEPALTPTKLLEHLVVNLPRPYADPAGREPHRNLDHYIEAQVHCDVRLEEDVDRLVCDPSFRGTATGRLLESCCERYDIECAWHGGFELSPQEVPVDFRGPKMPSLAARVAVSGVVNATAIGASVASLVRDPNAWADRGSQAEVLQELKLLWHVLVRFGRPSA